MNARNFSAEFAGGYRVTMSVSPTGFDCEWNPPPPQSLKGKAKEDFLSTYRIWRDDCLRAFAADNGLQVRHMPKNPDIIMFVRADPTTAEGG